MFAVTYTYGDDQQARAEHRPQHVEFLQSCHQRGQLRVSGPTTGDHTGALLVFETDNAADLERLLDGDPFFQKGLIEHRSIVEWSIVFGGLA